MSDKPREIWFRRTWLWGATAVHWKGVAVILIGVAGGLIGSSIGDRLGKPMLSVVLFLVAFAWTFIVAELHTGPRK